METTNMAKAQKKAPLCKVSKIALNSFFSAFHYSKEEQQQTATYKKFQHTPQSNTPQSNTQHTHHKAIHNTQRSFIAPLLHSIQHHQQKTSSTKEKLRRHRCVPDPDGTGGIGGGDPLAVGGETRDDGRGEGDPLAVGGETCDGGRGGGDPLAVGGEKRDGGRLRFSDLGFHGATTMTVDDGKNGYEGESGKDEGRSERHRRRTRSGDVGGGSPWGEQ
ncbi:hypothetical protein LR48_Vigan03g174900 [Vigna angularis]|uniref:Uncharacterized protein n=1 Tax=Phaseolus angularis TaxID=3914 RepID=A0A0L9U6Q7_PHAAN|nr:hypothetical protein LR48_Vigan03g174900 [Vigna angularis]